MQSLPSPSPLPRFPIANPSFDVEEKTKRYVVDWCNPPPGILAVRVAALDGQLGRMTRTVADMLHVQSVVCSRQDCARRAASAYCARDEVCPAHILDPLVALAAWMSRAQG